MFRSASKGRATDKDPLRKYVILSRKATKGRTGGGTANVEGSTRASEETSLVGWRWSSYSNGMAMKTIEDRTTDVKECSKKALLNLSYMMPTVFK